MGRIFVIQPSLLPVPKFSASRLQTPLPRTCIIRKRRNAALKTNFDKDNLKIMKYNIPQITVYIWLPIQRK